MRYLMRYSMRYFMRYSMPSMEHTMKRPMEHPMERHYIRKAFHSNIDAILIAPFSYLNCKNTQPSNNCPTTVQQLSNNRLMEFAGTQHL
jgi:coenzyme F420-reducing hydrogenase delta subunit